MRFGSQFACDEEDMDAWNRGTRPRRAWSVVTALIASLTAGYVAFHAGGWAAPAGTAAQQRNGRVIAGTANLSGSVSVLLAAP